MSIEKGVTGLLGYKLKKTQHALRLHMDEALRALDLTTPQYSVLAQTELRPGISNAALARSAFITPQTMHAIVSNLENRGFLQRKSDSKHGRILCVELTDAGYKTVTEAHNIVREVENRMLSTVSHKLRMVLERLLSECFNNLNKDNTV